MADALDPAAATEVAAARTLITTLLQEQYPLLSLRVGPLADLVAGPSAAVLAAVDARAVADVASLDPETALAEGGYDEDVLASALAGRGVSRGAAAPATGTAAIVFSTSTQRYVPTGFRLRTSDGVYYAVSSAIRLLAPGSTAEVDGTDVVMTAVPNSGGYAGTVPITAEEDGVSANRPAGTALTPETALSGQTSAFAATDLSGGADAESDAALLARLPTATAARTTASAAGCEALVTDAYAFTDVYVAGFGDDNMRRGRSALTSQTPGRTDVRVRTGSLGRLRLPVTATLDNVDGPYGVWRYTIATGDAPGFYIVEKTIGTNAVLSAAGYATTQTTHGYDITGVSPAPDVRTAADAAGSLYATALIKFADPDTSTSGLTPGVSTKTYDSVVRYVDGIEVAQDACNAPAALGAGGDCLVRWARPCLVTITGTATAPAATGLTAAQVAAAVSEAVNQTPIGTRVYAQVVAAAAQALLPSGSAVNLSSWSGTLYQTDDTVLNVSGSDGLSVTTDWTHDVGSGTVAFYCDAEDVAVTVTLT